VGESIGTMTAEPLFRDLDRLTSVIDRAGHMLVALDYDGTLAPIAETPEAAHMEPETEALLRELAASDRISLAIVSGRSLADLRKRLPVGGVIHVGNHGLEIEGAGVSFVHEGASMLHRVVDLACWDLEAALESVRGVRVERKGLTATVHYRQAPPDLAEWIQLTVYAAVDPYRSEIAVHPALLAWEIRPKLPWNKGSALRFLLGRMRAADPVLVCAGDDATDEDMFDVIPGAISVHVGSPVNTRARYFVSGTQELLRFLKLLSVRCLTPFAA
jgi:trehalose 6-phosphate phosphatase